MDIGYDILEDGGLRYAWKDARFKKCIESAAFINRSKGKLEDMRLYDFSKFRMYFADTRESVCILQNWKCIAFRWIIDL